MVEHIGWRSLIRGPDRIAARAALAAGGAGTVVLSSDRAVKRLNARHRRRNKPTNVLTFEPMRGFAGGDIVLALETVRREAHAGRPQPGASSGAIWSCTARCICAATTIIWLARPRRMEMAEARILHRIGVPNPWKRR